MKRLLALTLSLVMLISMAGCGNKTERKDVDINTLADQMKDALNPSGEVIEMTSGVIGNYYDMGDLIQEYKVYTSTVYLAEEVAVFRVKAGSKVSDAEKMLDARKTALLSSFDDYLPEQYKIVEENTKILVSGDIICLVVGQEAGVAAAEEIFNSLVK